jgi:hypothetical protein
MTAVLTSPVDRPTTEEMPAMTTTKARPETKRQRKVRKNPPIATDPAQNFRCSWEAWLLYEDACRAMGTNRSAHLRSVIDWVNHVPGAEAPRRPRLEQLHELEYLQEQQEQKRAARADLDGAA